MAPSRAMGQWSGERKPTATPAALRESPRDRALTRPSGILWFTRSRPHCRRARVRGRHAPPSDGANGPPLPSLLMTWAGPRRLLAWRLIACTHDGPPCSLFSRCLSSQSPAMRERSLMLQQQRGGPRTTPAVARQSPPLRSGWRYRHAARWPTARPRPAWRRSGYGGRMRSR